MTHIIVITSVGFKCTRWYMGLITVSSGAGHHSSYCDDPIGAADESRKRPAHRLASEVSPNIDARNCRLPA